MDWPAGLLKLLHIAVAMAFVTGVVGRWILVRRAAGSDAIDDAHRYAEAAEPFERMAIWGSNVILPIGMLTAWAKGYAWFGLTTGWIVASVVLLLSVVPFVPLVFIPRGKVFDAEMASARAAGQVTPGLRAAFADPAVTFARRYEIAAVSVIIALMVLKPF